MIRLTSRAGSGHVCYRSHHMIVLVAAALVVPAGCQRHFVYQASALPPQYQAPVVRSPHQLDLAGLSQSWAAAERIGPGDLLEISVTTGLEEDAASWPPIRVADDGSVELPLVGNVRLAGFEPGGAEQVIRQASIQRGIFRSPHVSVLLKSHRANRITVLGAVEEPGVKELPVTSCDLLSALVSAGGLAQDAATVIEIHRPPALAAGAEMAGAATGTPSLRLAAAHAAPNAVSHEKYQLDLAQVDPRSSNLQLPDGAVVMVMKQPLRAVHVIGLVQKPDEIELPADQDVRLLDAIAKAGGVTLQVADKVQVIRQVPGQEEPVVIRTTLRSAKRDGRANIRLAAGDVVSVEETPLTFAVDTLRSFIRFGFTGAIPGF